MILDGHNIVIEIQITSFTNTMLADKTCIQTIFNFSIKQHLNEDICKICDCFD